MRRALRPGGWLLLIFPNRWSLKGLLTRLTPLWFHRLGYRMLFGPGCAPYETRFDTSVSAAGILSFADRAELQLLALEDHPGNFAWLIRKHSPLLGSLWLLASDLPRC